jgi:hypothetical protein
MSRPASSAVRTAPKKKLFRAVLWTDKAVTHDADLVIS